jgi:L,D-transpeptidase YcbB
MWTTAFLLTLLAQSPPAGVLTGWTRNGVDTEQARAVLDLLHDAAQKGLDPSDYQVAPSADQNAAGFDRALTTAVMRYALDLHVGRANPGLYHSKFDIGQEKDEMSGLLRKLVNANDVRAVLAGIEPPFDGYQRTEKALRTYLAAAKADDGTPLPAVTKPVDPGRPYAGLARLAQLLRRVNDLPADAVVAENDTTYKGALVTAVKQFQARHGLDVDGRIGNTTLAALNVPLSRRAQQLALTLERWRWVPHSFPAPPIVINIPEFKLRAYDAEYHEELAMKVVVGRAYKQQTPVLSADLRTVTFHPYWHVPMSIQTKELIPAIRKDRSYLAKNAYEVVTPQNTVVTSGDINDEILERLRSGKLQIRQVPGRKNALGSVVFQFPNSYDVYLHDTPARSLFASARRDFSHGCIRAEKPDLLAHWVLQRKAAWPPERIDAALEGSETITVAVDKPIPVLVVYATAVVQKDGAVHFFQDIYGQDAALEKLLATPATNGEPGPRRRE